MLRGRLYCLERVDKYHLLDGFRAGRTVIWPDRGGVVFLTRNLVSYGTVLFLLLLLRAHNSAVECHLHTVEVVGSNPAVPTIFSTT